MLQRNAFRARGDSSRRLDERQSNLRPAQRRPKRRSQRELFCVCRCGELEPLAKSPLEEAVVDGEWLQAAARAAVPEKAGPRVM